MISENTGNAGGIGECIPESQSVLLLYLYNGLEFFIKFWSSDLLFNIMNVINVVTWLFLEILSGVQLLTRMSTFTPALQLTFGRD